MADEKTNKPFANSISWSNVCLVEEKPTDCIAIAFCGAKNVYSKRNPQSHFQIVFRVAMSVPSKRNLTNYLHQALCKLHFAER